jgi:hypothetical protein
MAQGDSPGAAGRRQGSFFSMLVPETKDRSFEQIEREVTGFEPEGEQRAA